MLSLTNIYDNLLKNINIRNPKNIISYSIIAFIIIIIVIFLLYIRRTLSLNTTTSIFGSSSHGKNCNTISKFFTSKPPLISAVDSPELSKHGLSDFYIKPGHANFKVTHWLIDGYITVENANIRVNYGLSMVK